MATRTAGTDFRGALRRTSLLWRLRPVGSAWRVCFDADVLVEGVVWLPGPGEVVVKRGARLLGGRAPIELRAHPGGRLSIEEDAVIEGGVSIEATESVQIGAGARIGAFCKILDNHFHRASGDRGERPESSPVLVGERAVLGPRVVLLPGAVVGAGSRIGPARVISYRVPAGVEVGGRAESRGPSGARTREVTA